MVFIHRSVGHHLMQDGKLRELIQATGKFSIGDYDQNTDVLTDINGTQRKMEFLFPGGNTRPEDLSVIFSDSVPSQHKSIQDEALRYDVIAVKSCYPNSNIGSSEELEKIKQHYKTICGFFMEHDKELVMLTSPPLAPLMTKHDNAARARELAIWLTSTDFGNTIKVFDFFNLLAASPGTTQPNTLKKKYRRWLPVDSHPNPRASREIAPQFVDFLQTNIR